MNDKIVVIKKNSGDLEPFSIQKFSKSLQNSGASNEEIERIVKTIQLELYDGISSNLIYRKAFRILKKYNRDSASKYSLKRAIFELGPTGFPFERLISALLKQKGYKTKIGEILHGECITHEIDVLAEKDGNVYTIECKFHTDPSAVSNVKIPLYINSRFIDVQKVWNNSGKTTHLKQGWLVTNTRFTKDAIDYANCVNLTLLSWDYPKNNGIKNNIDKYGLYPITTLTSLTKKEKIQLIEKDIILVKELSKNPDSLHQLGFSEKQKALVLAEVHKLCILSHP
ncbi:restriction endonuclease [Lutibacter sp.]|uniref:restriction endonuclease n=1 Tax=Lutibacter sp. TaxID=1925666 RepID=UPI002736C066|nr:restriction endonuclease [Lutibacter sp.]MDP3311781.1 restriction endonuclease [Lutibacter sp.]